MSTEVHDPWAAPPAAGDEFRFDSADFDTDEMGGGEIIDKEGWYHLEVADVKPELAPLDDRGNPRTPSIRFDLLVLHSAPKQSPAGSRHFHRIYMGTKGGGVAKDASKEAAIMFGLGVGILNKQKLNGKHVAVDAATGSTMLNVATFLRAKGKQCVAKISFKKGDDKYKDAYEIKFGRTYRLDDPAVADVPKNAEALAMAGKLPAAPPPPAATAQPARDANSQPRQASFPQQPAATVPPPEAAEDDLSDL